MVPPAVKSTNDSTQLPGEYAPAQAATVFPAKPVHSEESCAPVRSILSRVGDKWSILTIMLLRTRPYRFGELRRSIEGVSQRMLTLTLRGLERDGLVTRTVFPTNPPQVQYALTELGQSICEPVHALGRWAYDNLNEIVSARREFDEAAAERA